MKTRPTCTVIICRWQDFSIACSRRSDNRARRGVGSELSCKSEKRGGGGTGGGCDVGRETSVIESRGHLSYYKQCNQAFPAWGIFSWRAVNLLEPRSPRPGRFRDSSSGLWETFIFLLFPRRIINVIKGKVGESISAIIIVAPLLAIMTLSSSEFGMTATTAIGWGQEEGMDKETEMWKEGVRVRSFIEAQKGKKILFERLFSRNKKINALTEVKENQYF